MANTAKKTTDMTAAERRTLQKKLDAALAKAISDVSVFAHVYDIEPSIRITNNKSRLGSAKVTNNAYLDKNLRRRLGIEKWTKDPTFKISISTQECTTDKDMMDTLYHEVIHCTPNCFNHGKHFKALAAKVNAAYDANVETRKKASASCNSRFASGIPAYLPPLPNEEEIDIRSSIAAHIGESFKRGRKTYTFTGFNTNPKNCCDLVDGRGVPYKCSLEACAHFLGI